MGSPFFRASSGCRPVMKIRLVTATRGDSPFFADMLGSAARALPNAEHVVVCPENKREALQQGKRFSAVAEKNAGLYSAIEQGLSAPGGDWDAFTWINDDDLLVPSGLPELLETMSRHTSAGVAYGRATLIDRRSRRLGEVPVARCAADLGPLLARGVVPFAQPGTLIRRTVWETIGGFDLSYRYAGDLDFFVRALRAGTQFTFVDSTVASFRLHEGQLSKNADEIERETQRALRPLAGVRASVLPLWRFRLGNLGVYFERLRRHGFVSMRTLYQRTK